MIDSKKILGTACLLIAVSAGPAAVAAEREPAGTSITVSFAELDLSKTEGVDALYTRLQKAADRVCGRSVRTVSPMTLADTSEKVECYKTALSNAVASLDLEALSDKHAS